MGTRLRFDNIQVETPPPSVISNSPYDSSDAHSPPPQYNQPTRTPGTVTFHPSVNRQQHEHQISQQFNQDDCIGSYAHIPETPSGDRAQRVSPEEALSLVRRRIRTPGSALSPLFHVLFPAPRGTLSRVELCDELCRMFDLDRIVAAKAVAVLDPQNRGINFDRFASFMQGDGGDVPPEMVTPRTPCLNTELRAKREHFSVLKESYDPQSTEWVPRVFSLSIAHSHKGTKSNLGSNMVPVDGAREKWGGGSQVGLTGLTGLRCTNDITNSHLSIGMVPEDGSSKAQGCGRRGDASGFDHLEAGLIPQDGASRTNPLMAIDESIYYTSNERRYPQ